MRKIADIKKLFPHESHNQLIIPKMRQILLIIPRLYPLVVLGTEFPSLSGHSVAQSKKSLPSHSSLTATCEILGSPPKR